MSTSFFYNDKSPFRDELHSFGAGVTGSGIVAQERNPWTLFIPLSIIFSIGAHNVQGIQALIKTLRRIFPRRRFRFVFSILADKNYEEMIRLICSVAEKVYIAQNHSDRAATVDEQASEVQKHGVPYQIADSVAEAYQLAKSELTDKDILVCGGSLYTVGEVLQTENQPKQKRI